MATATPPRTPASNPRMVPLEDRIVASIAKGFEVSLGSRRALDQEVLNAQREMLQRSEMIARSLADIAVAAGSPDQTFSRMRQGITNTGLQPPPPPAAPPDRPEPGMSPMASAGPESALSAPGPTGGYLRDRRYPGNDESGWDTYAGARQNTRQNVRNRAAGWVNTRAEEWASRPMEGVGMLGTDRHGRLIATRPGVAVEAGGRFRGPGGRFTPAGESVIPGVAQQAVRRSAVARSVSDVASAWESGQPFGRALLSALPAGAVKAGGVAAAGVAVANEVWGRIQSEAGKNRELQEYYGGSNTDQIGERWERFKNTIAGRFDILGSGTYDRLWEMSMQHGLRGQDRKAYINEGSKLRDQGVGFDQIGSIFQIAIDTGQALSGLAGNLKEVNAAAREAGSSAKEARETFVQNYRMSSGFLLGTGGSAQTLATGLTTGAIGLGEAYRNTSYAGMYQDDSLRYSLAYRNGLTSTELISAERANPGTIAQLGEKGARDRLVSLQANEAGKPKITDVIKAYLASIGGPNNYVPEIDLPKLGIEIEKAGYDRRTLAGILRQYGISFSNDSEAPGLVASLFLDESIADSATELAKSKAQSVMMPKAPVAAGTVLDKRVNAKGFYSDANTNAVFGATGRFLNQYNIPNQPTISGNWVGYLHDAATDKDAEGRTIASGQALSPVVGQLLQNQNEFGLNGRDTKVIVTVNGQRREVTLGEAIANFSDQIQAGTAIISSGAADRYNRRTVQDILGLPSNWTGGGVTVSSDKNAALSTMGKEFKGWDETKKEAEDREASGGTIKLEMDPELQRILTAYMDYGPSSSGVPIPVGSGG